MVSNYALILEPMQAALKGVCHLRRKISIPPLPAPFNSPVFNSGLRAEEEQIPWLEQDLEANRDKRIFLFTHYPPYILEPNEPSNYDNIDEPRRAWLLELLERPGPGVRDGLPASLYSKR